VDNRPGAGGMLAAEHVAGSPADGHTILTGAIALLVFNPVLCPRIRYSPLGDFQPIGLMARWEPLIRARGTKAE
jgi:tripartite-type tricarboxylate transporter receptor subunit TctC